MSPLQPFYKKGPKLAHLNCNFVSKNGSQKLSGDTWYICLCQWYNWVIFSLKNMRIYFYLKQLTFGTPTHTQHILFWIDIYFLLWKYNVNVPPLTEVVLGIDSTNKSRVPFFETKLHLCALEWTPINLFHIFQTFKSFKISLHLHSFTVVQMIKKCIILLLCAQFACKTCKTSFIYWFFLFIDSSFDQFFGFGYK